MNSTLPGNTNIPGVSTPLPFDSAASVAATAACSIQPISLGSAATGIVILVAAVALMVIGAIAVVAIRDGLASRALQADLKKMRQIDLSNKENKDQFEKLWGSIIENRCFDRKATFFNISMEDKRLIDNELEQKWKNFL